MNATKISTETLHEIIGISTEALPYFNHKNHDEIIHFVFCALEKINKSTQGIARLYSALDGNDDLEFPIGILLRSLMMDNLMIQNIKHKIFTQIQENSKIEKLALKKIIQGVCYKFLSDGTDNLIKGLKLSDNLTPSEKEAAAKRFANVFPKAFDLSAGMPKLKANFKFRLKELYLNSKHESLVSLDSTYNLYTFYSKYDHLSHWTSLAKRIPFEQRKGKVDLAIVIVLMQLRDVLVLAYDFDPDYTVLEPLLEQIQQHLRKEYDPEIYQSTIST